MLYFENDYCEGAHEAILKRLLETNMEKVPGYGQDPYCDQAKEKIKAACGCTDGEVYFLVGGTQTNAVVIASMLNRYEGVLSAVTGHVNAHEAGAIEFTGHKVLPLPQKDGKISAADLKNYLETYYADGSYDHMVFPGMVYREWYIFPIPQNTEPFTPDRNWKIFPVCAENMRSRCSWTAQDLDTAWWHIRM